jgi:glycosyltransferase involved in cell wall biosynthesis/radical SAM superfamily enzyme YgiQ (UPF0313 family)
MYAPGHDLWHPGFVSKAVALMESDHEIILAYSRAMRIDANNNAMGLANNAWDLRGMAASHRLNYLVNNIYGGDPCFGLIRHNAIQQFLNKYDRFVWGNDQVMLAYFSLLGTIAHIPEPLFYLRMTDNENVEVRKSSVPLDNDPVKGRRMLGMSMPELWRQMGGATLQVINHSDLTMPEKLACKDEVRKCFVRRYGVQWNEVIPSELKGEGKNILLTTSAAPGQTPFSTNEKRPPVGMGFLISTLRDAGHNVFFIDNYLSPSNFLETDYLQRHRIDIVGIYTNTICFRDSLRMFYRLEELRQCGAWHGKIIAGGPHASVSPETIPPFVDHIVIGEGEYALRDIVAGKARERIIKYPTIENLDELPMPAWDYFAEMPYDWGGNWLPEAPVFTMNTSRGCPFSCTFCSVCSIWGKRYTCFSAERVVADIEHVIREFGAKGVYFREDNFTLKRDRLVRFCQLLIERNIRIPWVCESRVSNLDRDLVALMARAGAVGFYFGVESGSQRLLDFMKKGISVEQIRNAFHWCNEFNIKTAASVIVGVPSETEEDLQSTMTLLKDINPTVTWFNIFVGIPNSELLDYARKNNYVEFTDDRGLAYLKGHNRRTELFYGSAWDAKIPITLVNNRIAHPQISVVMSVYNGEKHLQSAVQSVLAQNFLNYEFIIVDDASSDATPEILKACSDPRITIIRNNKNLGLTASLNVGIRAASGKYIARMDADDLSVPYRFAQQFDFLETNPSIAVVGSSYYTINEEGAVAGIINVLAKPADIKRELPRQNWFGHGSVMMRKSCVEEIGGYDERFVYAQDYDLFLRLSERYDLANMTTPLYYWRESSKGISSRKKEDQKHFAEMARSAAAARRNRITGNGSDTVSQTNLTPLVSVIVPTHNRQEMLATAISSILSQTMRSFEIIVINDAGTDVLPVLQKFEGKGNIRYIAHETNRGLAAARNTGIQAARGKYIAYLDDDDTFYPNHLETLTNFLESNDCRVAYTDANRALQQKTDDGFVTVKREVIYSRDFDYDAILFVNFIPVLCIMHEKDCLSRSGMFDESLSRHEDWDLWIRMSRHERFAHLKTVTCEFTYRPEGSSMTSSSMPLFLKTYKAVCVKYDDIVKEKPLVQSRRTTTLFNATFNTFQFIGYRLEPYLSNSSVTGEMLTEITPSGAVISQIKSSFFWRKALSMDDAAAIPYLEIALDIDSENHPARIALCERYLRTGRHADALRHIEFLAEANPNEPEFRKTMEVLKRQIATVHVQAGSHGHASDSVQPCDIRNRPVTVSVYSLDARQGACAQIRLLSPFGAMNGAIESNWGAVSEGTNCTTNLDILDQTDVIVLQRFFPRKETIPFIEKMLLSGKPVIYEVDELLTDLPEGHNLKLWARETEEILPWLLPQVSAITVSTPLLAEEFSSMTPSIHVVTNLVDTKLFRPASPKLPGPVVIGFCAAATHAHDLTRIENALFRVAERYGSKVAFSFMGHATSRSSLLPGFRFVDFQKDYESYGNALSSSGIDIAIVPLQDNRFNRCKSNIKWLEYSACGIAGIYADLPPYNTSVEHGVSGVLVADDPDKWFQAICLLIDHPELRHTIAREANRRVQSQYSLTGGAQVLYNLYEYIANGNLSTKVA